MLNHILSFAISFFLLIPLTFAQVSVTINTNPAGRSIVVDGQTLTAPVTYNWTAGSVHSIGTTTNQSGGTGIRYVWFNWSDAGAMTHNITIPNATSITYTANFNTEFQLTMSKIGTGSIYPLTSWRQAGEQVQITATAAYGYKYLSWSGSGTGSYTGTNNPAIITINGPITETANFNQVSIYSISGSVKTSDNIAISSVKMNYGQTEVLDQFQTAATFVNPIYARWQSFMPSTNKISKIEFFVGKYGTLSSLGPLVFSIADTNNVVLFTKTLQESEVISGWNSIQINPSLNVLPEIPYKILLNSSSVYPDYWYGWAGGTSTYTRGRSDISSNPDHDYEFRVYSGDLDILTDASGLYTIKNYSGWNGTVTPIKGSNTFVPPSINYQNLISNQINQNYVSPQTISISPSSLGFGNVVVGQYSNPQTYNVSGINLTGNITITSGNSAFQVSLNGTNWSSSLTLTQSGGTVPTTTIYARFAPTLTQVYSGNIIHTSTGATTQNVAVSGTGVPAQTPQISVTPQTLTFGNVVVNTNSAPQTYTVSGNNLTGNITITSGNSAFQVSLNGTNWSSSLNLTQSGGTVPTTTIYARFAPTLTQVYSSNITHTSTGATTQNVAVSGTGVPAQTPQISVTPQTLTFGNVVVNTNSAPQTYTVSGNNLTGNITITSGNSAFQVSLNGTNWSSSLTLTQSGGTVPTTTIYARFAPTLTQVYSSNITHTSTGATTQNVAVSGTGVPAQTPQISVTPQTLTFGNVVVNTNSAPQTYTVSGNNLTGNITITSGNSAFQVSLNGTNWSSSLNLTQSGGTVPTTTIYARFAPTLTQVYSSNITHTSTGATTQNVAVSGTGVPAQTPQISVTPQTLTFGNVVVNTNSAPQTYTVSGNNLTGNITITSGNSAFQVSLNGTNWSSSLTLTQSGGTVPTTTIYARFAPTLTQVYSSNITHTSTGATTQNVAVSGTGVPAQTPQISVTPQTLTFGNVVVNTNSAPQTYTVSGNNLTGNITITSGNSAFQVSLNGTNWSSSLTLTQSGGTVPTTTIYARFAPTLTQVYSSNITHTSTGATTQNVAVSGIGVPAQTPQISVTPQTLTFGNVVVNTNSAPQTYTVSGNNLTGNITITSVNSAFQVSLNGTNWSSSLTLTQSGGTVPTTTIYTRFAPTVAQVYSDNITHTSTNATTINVAVSGTGVLGCNPNWTPVQNQQYTMNVIAQLILPEGLSTNLSDIVGAFVGTECRGIASPTSDNGRFYLSISSNQASGETIIFKAWKSSTCEELPVVETLVFQDNQIIGTYSQPFQFNAGLSTQNLSFNPLYTWFSLNVDPGDLSINSVFPNPPTNSKIIGQTNFAVWTGTSWVGSLTQLDPKRGYVMYVEQAYNVSITGLAIDPVTNSISLGTGWNWTGYLPQDQLATSIALQNTNPFWVDNELIKSQTQFSIYGGGNWSGSLTTLSPGKGYKIQVSANKNLTYPANTLERNFTIPLPILSKQNDAPPNWVPIPNMQYSMNVIAKLQIGINAYSTNPNDIVGAFVIAGTDTQCRGIQSPDQASGLIFLSIGSNSASGEVVIFKAYRSDLDQVVALTDTFHFQDNRFIGLPDPYIFNGIVPVELTTFTASYHENKIELNWTTATETNNTGFDIEKSTDQAIWTKIGFVSGKGTTTEITDYSYADNNCTKGLYYYRLKQIDFNGSFEYSQVISVEVESTSEFVLSQNFPNPFNPSSNINYSLPKESFVIIKVYNILGDEVEVLVNEKKSAGHYSLEFNATNLPSGIYFYKFQADNYVETKKMILLK